MLQYPFPDPELGSRILARHPIKIIYIFYACQRIYTILRALNTKN